MEIVPYNKDINNKKSLILYDKNYPGKDNLPPIIYLSGTINQFYEYEIKQFISIFTDLFISRFPDGYVIFQLIKLNLKKIKKYTGKNEKEKKFIKNFF